ncbi:MAG: hypothetical protein RL619_806 [Bacteroidota bacterium]|jgi:hypothetical protein
MFWENVLRLDANMPLRLWYHYDDSLKIQYQLGSKVATSGVMTIISDLIGNNLQIKINGL